MSHGAWPDRPFNQVAKMCYLTNKINQRNIRIPKLTKFAKNIDTRDATVIIQLGDEFSNLLSKDDSKSLTSSATQQCHLQIKITNYG